MTHTLSIRVYYEDTDLAGIVYYANYLKFIERGRSEWIAALGVDQMALRRDQGVVFAVRRVVADYLKPAHFGEVLTVTSRLTAVSGARFEMAQQVRRGDAVLFAADVTCVCIGASGAAARIPAEIRQRLAQDLG
ncbi:MAG: tol-pal system-associated acyl-CoA thioesterase [Phaeovulum sp.]|uniref:tol-pal system-associated acyl-CoA thioesterase n=1 Tax=Phaeovulum sp. TaxID=2934796 RepID=UPI002730D2D9|nr:tol-pal system-associated acyl-CoA thioesterase [Phaeovulum sp.]MDP2063676.1 tol-pal system-associated acyl-CoA thioesterase [Phaeovulum sp.]